MARDEGAEHGRRARHDRARRTAGHERLVGGAQAVVVLDRHDAVPGDRAREDDGAAARREHRLTDGAREVDAPVARPERVLGRPERRAAPPGGAASERPRRTPRPPCDVVGPCPAARVRERARRGGGGPAAAQTVRTAAATTATDGRRRASPTPIEPSLAHARRAGGAGGRRDLGTAVHDGDNPARIADAARERSGHRAYTRRAPRRPCGVTSRARVTDTTRLSPRRCRNGGRAVPSLTGPGADADARAVPPPARRSQPRAPAPAAAPRTRGVTGYGRRHHEAAAGLRRALRAPDPPLEPEDEALHLHRAQRHLHHRPAADAVLHRPRLRVRAARPSRTAARSCSSAPRSRRRRPSPTRRAGSTCRSSTSAGSAACSPTSRPCTSASSA